MDITYNGTLNVFALDTMVRTILGDNISGVTIGDNSRIHLINDTANNQAKAQAIFAGLGDLIVSADKTTMTEGDSDPVVTCADSKIAGDVEVGYVALLDGQPYADGQTTVSGSVATLNLIAPVAGIYDIYLYRLTGTYVSGSVQITVNEV